MSKLGKKDLEITLGGSIIGNACQNLPSMHVFFHCSLRTDIYTKQSKSSLKLWTDQETLLLLEVGAVCKGNLQGESPAVLCTV